jgi:hypothetical protein
MGLSIFRFEIFNLQKYIKYEYTQADEIDAVETFHETSLQFQRKDTFFRIRCMNDKTLKNGYRL